MNFREKKKCSSVTLVVLKILVSLFLPPRNRCSNFVKSVFVLGFFFVSVLGFFEGVPMQFQGLGLRCSSTIFY